MAVRWYENAPERVGRVLLNAKTIRNRVRSLGAQITEDYRGKHPHVIGILKGAGIFHADLIRSIPLGISYDFMAVASYGSRSESSGEVRILKDLDESLNGKDVLLVEDILDSGVTLRYLLRNLQARGPKSVRVVTLLRKASGRKTRIRLDYVGFEIPDEFVVGYGLDFNQRYRNLPYIATLTLPLA